MPERGGDVCLGFADQTVSWPAARRCGDLPPGTMTACVKWRRVARAPARRKTPWHPKTESQEPPRPHGTGQGAQNFLRVGFAQAPLRAQTAQRRFFVSGGTGILPVLVNTSPKRQRGRITNQRSPENLPRSRVGLVEIKPRSPQGGTGILPAPFTPHSKILNPNCDYLKYAGSLPGRHLMLQPMLGF
jgi:hypothetical protein